VRPELVPTAVWLIGMLIGLGYTLRAVQQAHADADRFNAHRLLREVAEKNLRTEVLRTLTLGTFALVGVLVMVTQTIEPPEPLMAWVRWANTLLILVGGLGVVANSVLDARYRQRLRDQMLVSEGET
jgi:uncharacterized membrane protein (DUF4010 family)